MLKPSDRAPLPLNALRAFEAAARQLNFTRAASELNVTQGAVSRQVKQLENLIGKRLFHRFHRQIALTDQGQTLFNELSPAFDAMAAAMSRMVPETTALNLKVHPTFAIRWLMPRLHKFQTRHPDIQIRFTTSNVNANLKQENFDIAVTYRQKKRPGICRLTLLEEDLTPVCSPDLADGDPPLTHPSDLAFHRLLHNSPDQREWRAWAKQTGTANLSFEKGQIFEFDDAALQAATAGLGVALGDRLLVKDDLVSGRLIEPFAYTKINTGQYYLSWLEKNRKQPGLMAFKDWLMAEMSTSLNNSYL
jgi:LysR family glycine cleavage system transcriptional activator